MASVLLVVGNTTLSTDDQALSDHFTSTRGDTVTTKDDSDTELQGGYDLVVISESCASGTVDSKYLDSTMPVLSMEGYALDAGGAIAWTSGNATLAGSRTSVRYVDGTEVSWTGETTSTTVTVQTSANIFRNTATFGSGYRTMCDYSTTPSNGTVAGTYEYYDTVYGGNKAQGRYAWLGFTAYNSVTTKGLQLIDDLVDWLIEGVSYTDEFSGGAADDLGAGWETDFNQTPSTTVGWELDGSGHAWVDGDPADNLQRYARYETSVSVQGWAEMKIGPVSASSDAQLGVCFRVPDAGDSMNGYMVMYDHTTAKLFITETSSGTTPSRTNLSTGVSYTLTENDLIGIEVIDNSSGNPVIKSYKNGSVQETYTDTSKTHITGGRGGLFANAPGDGNPAKVEWFKVGRGAYPTTGNDTASPDPIYSTLTDKITVDADASGSTDDTAVVIAINPNVTVPDSDTAASVLGKADSKASPTLDLIDLTGKITVDADAFAPGGSAEPDPINPNVEVDADGRSPNTAAPDSIEIDPEVTANGGAGSKASPDAINPDVEVNASGSAPDGFAEVIAITPPVELGAGVRNDNTAVTSAINPDVTVTGTASAPLSDTAVVSAILPNVVVWVSANTGSKIAVGRLIPYR